MLSSYEDFIEKVGGKKKLSRLKQEAPFYVNKKSKTTAYLLWFFGLFGILGLHRFYLGKAGTGIAWLFTGGLFGMGALYDVFALSGMVDEENTYHELRAAQIQQLTGK
ncbi:MAG: TM2 domain-containing protein [Balneolaceae bacterium]|nr:TM2 domain-containing protein [Balneolaceae bacterium]